MPAVYPSSVFNFLFLTCPFPWRRDASSPTPRTYICTSVDDSSRGQTPEKRTVGKNHPRLVKRLAGSCDTNKKITRLFPSISLFVFLLYTVSCKQWTIELGMIPQHAKISREERIKFVRSTNLALDFLSISFPLSVPLLINTLSGEGLYL